MTQFIVAFSFLTLLGSCSVAHRLKFHSEELNQIESSAIPVEEEQKNSPFHNVEFGDREAPLQ